MASTLHTHTEDARGQDGAGEVRANAARGSRKLWVQMRLAVSQVGERIGRILGSMRP